MYTIVQLKIIKEKLEENWDNVVYNSHDVIEYLLKTYEWDDVEMANEEVLFLVGNSTQAEQKNNKSYVIGGGSYCKEWDHVIRFNPKDSINLDILEARPEPIDPDYDPINEFLSIW